jgi:RNA polymerase-binding transcription factor DksA
MDEDRARKLIEGEMIRVGALAADLRAEGITTQTEQDQVSELAGHSQHQADLGSETFEREKDLSLLESLEFELASLEVALRKIDEGTYGVCEACGEEIPAERLEAMPGTRFCIADQTIADGVRP